MKLLNAFSVKDHNEDQQKKSETREEEKNIRDKGRERELALQKCASNKCLFTI